MNEKINTMINLARQALQHAYAPYSHYSVASCLCTKDNTLYTGVNVENASYGLTICAEASAICQMVSSGKKKIQDIIIMAGNNLLCSPCGACRQRIYEFSMPSTQVHLCNQDSVLKTILLEDLLPLAFNLEP